MYSVEAMDTVKDATSASAALDDDRLDKKVLVSGLRSTRAIDTFGRW